VVRGATLKVGTMCGRVWPRCGPLAIVVAIEDEVGGGWWGEWVGGESCWWMRTWGNGEWGRVGIVGVMVVGREGGKCGGEGGRGENKCRWG
jgi:hypothetical protein